MWADWKRELGPGLPGFEAIDERSIIHPPGEEREESVMLSQLLIVRLKAAENALRDGRIDEAFRLAGASDLKEHRRGAAVLSALTERFIERARSHFRADRFPEALSDLDHARSGGVMAEQIAELHGQVQTVLTEQQRNVMSRRGRIDEAKRRIEGGSLAAGRRILEHASKHDHGARNLRRELSDRVKDTAELVRLAEKLIGQGQWAAAAERIKKAKTINAHDEVVVRAESKLCERVLAGAHRAVAEGRLARAADELACLGSLGDKLPAKREIVGLLAGARRAAQHAERHEYADARREVMALNRLMPKVAWIKETMEHLRHVEEVATALGAGPLGDSLMTAERSDPKSLQTPTSVLDDTIAIPYPGLTAGELPQRLLLLVDGGGSYLLLRGAQASLGRVASDDPADIPIISDLAERHANVSRVDDDYFLFASRDVDIAGHKTKHHLLQDGDRVVLGRKAKFTFRLPTRKSPTAVLDLSDTTKIPNDVRRVVLFSQHAMLGGGSNAHVRCPHAGSELILFERGGSLWIRAKNDGHVDTEARALKIGEPMEIAGTSFVLQPWTVKRPGRSTV